MPLQYLTASYGPALELLTDLYLTQKYFIHANQADRCESYLIMCALEFIVFYAICDLLIDKELPAVQVHPRCANAHNYQ